MSKAIDIVRHFSMANLTTNLGIWTCKDQKTVHRGLATCAALKFQLCEDYDLVTVILPFQISNTTKTRVADFHLFPSLSSTGKNELFFRLKK